ncbi:helix-turn-helix domain-containing protein [Acinetobacter sp. ANC 3813]|uniref:helix-turn-helix domain-containing protein n=1 Tax=Acinetobacter sp. ANC 3813 TaxID=1977873 RepID=UPI000A33407A|nr:helix-turn-helix transcriptional regulator [Acinetobacter sp. ANC 3813]OTG87827.1 hypothetical protein B9T34_15945 [Acinetobacter sp. ANC 3813]
MSESEKNALTMSIEAETGQKFDNQYKFGTDAKEFDRRLYACVGHNLQLAREISGLSRSDAMYQIWGYKNKNMSPNRISEMESGTNKIELRSVYKACVVYGCSPEFIFGFTDEFEMGNIEAKMAGLVFRSVRESVMDATSTICEGMAQSLRHLPPYQGELLRQSAKGCVDLALKYAHDMVFRAQYGDLLDAIYDLQTKTQQFDRYFARQMRQIELNMASMLDKDQDTSATKKMTMTVVKDETVSV